MLGSLLSQEVQRRSFSDGAGVWGIASEGASGSQPMEAEAGAALLSADMSSDFKEKGAHGFWCRARHGRAGCRACGLSLRRRACSRSLLFSL